MAPATLRHLLVATDFSEGATRASERAARLARPDTLLTLLHVVPPDTAAPNAVAAARALLWERAERLRALTTCGVEPVVASGEPMEQILLHADHAHAELIVLGRHATELSSLLLGTTAERVVRHGRFPTLIVNLPPTRPYRTLLAAVDLPPGAEERAVALGLLVCGDAHRRLELLHLRDDALERAARRAGISDQQVVDDRNRLRADAAATLATWLRSLDATAPWHVTVEEGDARQRIVSAVEHLQPDVLCLGTQARKGLPRLILGSVAEAVVKRVTCDILIAPPHVATG
ncbi:MAG: universal stress protein [Myxococcales bacterium]|nr:universal stress protein [Myxococcales bacterium]